MLDFSIYTINGDHEFSIKEENDFTFEMYSKLLTIFSDIDYENHIVNFCCQQQMNAEILEKISAWVLEYESANIQLRKVKAYFENITEGEFFFVFPQCHFTPRDILMISENLQALNSKIDQSEIAKQIEKVQNIYNNTFKIIFDKYDIHICNTFKKQIYGEIDKNKRCCIYCGKTIKDGAKFKNIAHAISEALGNKTIISADECDSCNSKFAETIEKDIIQYLHLYRVLYGKKGKNGIPHLKYENGIDIEYCEGKATIIDAVGVSSFKNGIFNIPLKCSEPINFMNIYRALVKFAIGVMPKNDVAHLTKTIEWINDIKNDGKKLALPPVAILLDNQNYFDQPELCLYIRKYDDNKLPHIYAEFKSTFFIFVYIIPFSDKDTVDFSKKENFNTFWVFNKHYSAHENWTFNNFDVDKDVVFTLNINLTNAKEINKE